MDQNEDEDEEDSPTPSLIPSLSLLETHLSHLVPVLQPSESIPIYRSIARNVSQHIVDRVIISGGSHRFDQAGALRFERDYTSGWMSVLNSLSTLAQDQVSSGQLTGLGRQPEAAWRHLRDTILLLNLSAANVDQTSSSTASSTLQHVERQRSQLLSTDARKKWTLARATRALFDEDPANDTRGWVALKQDLGIAETYDLNTAKEVLRRRVECPK
ncbi:RAD50-INTERACTING PROTEIN 1 (PROTEIN RINT-1) [Ceraceosorus bombacis]|uniref:RAD50-INTERACTING PROTEIN 1 (PROTEIN RINT-1) n=1 Tax=Ceraceosorus bombacis TaxID=401625 RepID=A0A0P1BP36_9BASI|nr:RAD50-INTERACTING PROTEIN 1 (PROTEIN RINT-1) [Ceraceosorus bombacis]